MCSDILPRSGSGIPAAPVSCFQGETEQPILLIRHRLEHRHIAAKGAGDRCQVRATPQAFNKGFPRGDAATGQDTSVEIKIVNMHFGMRTCKIRF